MPISAVIITYNEARHIANCIQSLQGVADEILIVDAFSTDNTCQIAEMIGASVMQQAWQGYAQSKNAANALAKYDYILSIDADEQLSEEMRQAILALKKDLKGAYRFRRKNFFCGKWIRFCGWYPDKKVRLFSRREAAWQGDFVHETLTVEASIQDIEVDLLHFTYQEKEELPQKLQKYTSLAAEEMWQQGKKATFLKLYISPIVKFLNTYFLQLGCLDGYYGAYISYYLAAAVYGKYDKLRQKSLD